MTDDAPCGARARPGLALAVWLGFLGYFLLFVRWGFQVEDEGVQVLQIARVAAGDRPYVDFFTPYTPGFHWIRSIVWHASGGSLVVLRAAMAVVNASSAAVLFVLARRVATAPLALAAVVLWVALLPIDPGTFASFNVPYAAWFAVLAWGGCAMALLRWSERGRTGALMAAGLAVAAALAVKPNAGVFALAAASWVVALHAPRDGRIARTLATLAGLVMAAGLVLAVRLVWRSSEAILYLGPIAMLTATAYGHGFGQLARPGGRPGVGDLVVLWASCGLASALWILPLLAGIGPAGFARDVLFLGTEVDRIYWLPYPHLDRAALVTCGLVLAGVAVARYGTPVVRRAWWIALGGGGALLALYVGRTAPMPEGFGAAILGQLRRASFAVVPLALWGAGLALVAALRSRPVSVRWRTLAVLVPLASAMFVQMHPRADFSHLMLAMPLAVVVGVGFVQGVVDRLFPGRRTAAGAALLAAVAVLVVVIDGSVVASVVRCQRAGTYVELPRFRVCVDPASADDLSALAATAWWVRAHSAEGEAVLTFPSLGAVLVGAGRRSPTRHDYWFVGDPDHDAERAIVARLEASPPRLAVTFNDTPGYFLDAPAYYGTLRRFVTRRYVLVARFGRYDVLALRSVADGAAIARDRQPTGPLADAASPLPARRRQGVARWLNGLTPADAERPALPAATTVARLAVRAIAENADLRAIGWVLAGLASPEPALRGEARWGMIVMARRFVAARCRWADDLDVAQYRPYLLPHRDALEALAREDDPWIAELVAVTRSVLDGVNTPCAAVGAEVDTRKGQVLLDLVAPQ